MDELERAVRATLVDHTRGIQGVQLGPFVGSGGPRPHQRWSQTIAVVGTVVVVAALVVAAGLLGNRPRHGGTPGPAARVHTVWPSETTFVDPNAPIMCGAFRLEAVQGSKKTSLTGCEGAPGIKPLPTLRLGVGEQLSIRGLTPQDSLSESPGGVVRLDGTTVIGIGHGTALIEIAGPSCGDNGSKGCHLLRVKVQ